MKKIVIRFNAPVILSFALLSLIALLLGKWTNGATTTQFFSVYRSSLGRPADLRPLLRPRAGPLQL